MTLAEAILCGFIQGLAEFLPISSSGHLALAHALFGVGDVGYSLAFDVLLHFGTLFVVFVVYYQEIFALIPAFFKLMGKVFRGNFRFSSYSKEERFTVLLIVATLPMALGIFLKDRIEWLSSYPKIVGAVLILNGGMLLLSDHAARKSVCREMTPRGACAVGFFQLAALMPGLSRSGATIAGGLLSGASREDAVKFSFILSIPAILGANILSIPSLFDAEISRTELSLCLAGTIAAALSGFLAIKLLIYVSKRAKFSCFAYYSFAVGALSLILG